MLVLLPLGAMAQDPVVGATVRADSPIDQRLGKAVVGALERSENVAVRGLVATVDEGIVTLEGAVRTSAEKHLASRYARDVAGIQGVVNAITVEPAIGVP
jgi:osmotically-inducible protein OsmY